MVIGTKLKEKVKLIFEKMKTLSKLEINSKRIMKNEDLSLLKGGDEMLCCFCSGIGYMLLATPYNCNQLCEEASGGWSYGTWQCII